jgi:peroxiredoxin
MAKSWAKVEQPISTPWFKELATFNGQPVVLDNNKLTHLIFIDIWRSYEGKGDEKLIATLPKQFLHQSQQVWLQPEVNVTKAHLTEFQQHFPSVTPLILDQQFLIMRALNVWQSPYHVLMQGNEKLFSGDDTQLLLYLSKRYDDVIKNHKDINKKTLSIATETTANNATNSTVKMVKPIPPKKPIIGDKAPSFSGITLTGKKVTLADALVKLTEKMPLNLVFLDALCPMPHFPGCEEKLTQLNKLVAADNKRQWLGVVNSYYVNEEYAQGFADTFNLKIPLLFDQDNTIYRAYDVYASPYLIQINQLGFIESRGDVIR